MAASAFQLTIDVTSGRVTVSPPRSAAAMSQAAPGLSLSLLGRDAISVDASDCTFSSIPNSTKQKRCTMQLAIENGLQLSDLVTPTTFPKPPEGEGLLVFPYTAAALGVPGTGAVPNSQWDNAPINFFNDFAACSGKGTDCYRWERYPSPLAAGETSAARTVGFDVDKAAQSVSVYILVAADVRDAPPHSLTLTPVTAGCGTLGVSGGSDQWVEGELVAGNGITSSAYGLCTFELPGLLQDKSIVSATLTFHQVSATGQFAQGNGKVTADLVEYPVPPEDGGFNTITVLANLGLVTDTPAPGARSLDVLIPILTQLTQGRSQTQYRLIGDSDGGVTFAGVTGADTDPKLVVRYRNR
jgi:hypothetical protein